MKQCRHRGRKKKCGQRHSREKGGLSPEMKLDVHVTPKDFFDLIITPEFWKEHMVNTTTMRVAMEGAGNPNLITNYWKCTTFDMDEIDTFIDLILANGLYPSLQLQWAFKSQAEDCLEILAYDIIILMVNIALRALGISSACTTLQFIL